MSNRPPKLDPRAQRGNPVPPPKAADYSDEVSTAQIKALRSQHCQDESKMGALVHEFTW
jgi:hypothetical protein